MIWASAALLGPAALPPGRDRRRYKERRPLSKQVASSSRASLVGTEEGERGVPLGQTVHARNFFGGQRRRKGRDPSCEGRPATVEALQRGQTLQNENKRLPTLM